jgi:hypothetical protein
MNPTNELEALRTALGHRRLSRVWAKCEILLGLLATAVGLVVAVASISSQSPIDWPTLAAGVLLIVLGGYLTLAGHRSHLYQSNNELTAYLAEIIRARDFGPEKGVVKRPFRQVLGDYRGKQLFSTAEEVEEYIQTERNSWDK